jgi:hypothetical protein
MTSFWVACREAFVKHLKLQRLLNRTLFDLPLAATFMGYKIDEFKTACASLSVRRLPSAPILIDTQSVTIST